MPNLFDPLRVGDLTLPNRVVMAPLTRLRAGPTHIPNALMAEYYGQRAAAGLLITEGVPVTPQGVGYAGVPGIWSKEQTEGWKQVTRAVHDKGGRIFMQIWHVGRISDPSHLNGETPVGPSAIAAKGHVSLLRPERPYPTPRPLSTEEVAGVVEAFRQGAENAQAAGFDGVQLHGANGYLIDQFLRDSSNLRTDEYGGSPENRVRLLREVMERLIAVWGNDRVGVRLSPNGDSQGVDDSNPAAVFGLAAKELEKLKPAFVELRQPGPDGTFGATQVPQQDGLIRQHFTGPLVLNSDYTPEQAAADIASGRADAISFGRPFISNPDLVERIAKDAPLAPNKNVPESWYFPVPEGYTDYPTLAEETV